MPLPFEEFSVASSGKPLAWRRLPVTKKAATASGVSSALRRVEPDPTVNVLNNVLRYLAGFVFSVAAVSSTTTAHVFVELVRATASASL